jgi:Exo-beta-N-acetylmuramidase NamZ, C-terminal
VALRHLYPSDWKVDSYLRLLANTNTLERVKRGDAPRDIVLSWNSQLEEFRRVRSQVLLYD